MIGFLLIPISVLATEKAAIEDVRTEKTEPIGPSESVSADIPLSPRVVGSIYDRPYSLWENKIDGRKLARNTATLAVGSLAVLGILYAMPGSVTNWENNDRSPFDKWRDNVTRAPVVDEDDWFLNYVTHPYAGAIYYMSARSAGANAFYSFAYSAALSTFFWEYGVEAFAERPSIQDLIVTPVAGAILGEGFFLMKRSIVENDHVVCNSRALGKTIVFIIDPITEVTDWIWNDNTSGNQKPFSIRSHPTVTKTGHMGYFVNLQLSF